MKRITQLSAIMLFAFSLTATVQANPVNDEVAIAKLNDEATVLAEQGKWNAFSNNLVTALKSEHDGLKSAAMGMIIRYSAQVEVKDAVFEVMSIYQNHENESMRRMALVALGQMESGWAIRFLERAERFENSPVLRHTLRAVVAEYNASHAG